MSSFRYLYFVRLPYIPELAAHINDNVMIDQIFGPLVATKAITEDEVEAYKFTFSRRGKEGLAKPGLGLVS